MLNSKKKLYREIQRTFVEIRLVTLSHLSPPISFTHVLCFTPHKSVALQSRWCSRKRRSTPWRRSKNLRSERNGASSRRTEHDPSVVWRSTEIGRLKCVGTQISLVH